MHVTSEHFMASGNPPLPSSHLGNLLLLLYLPPFPLKASHCPPVCRVVSCRDGLHARHPRLSSPRPQWAGQEPLPTPAPSPSPSPLMESQSMLGRRRHLLSRLRRYHHGSRSCPCGSGEGSFIAIQRKAKKKVVSFLCTLSKV